MPRLIIALALLALASPAVCAEPLPAADAPALLKTFFAEEDAAKRADLAARFAAVAPKSWPDLKAMLHAAAPYEPLAAGTQNFTTPGDAAVPAVNYLLRVPAGYAADAHRGWPLIVVCHGTGGNARKALDMVEKWLGGDADNYLLAAPDAPAGGVYEAGRVMTDYPLHVLRDVRRRANVDSDRTFLAGVSKGGYTTWGTALFSPGEWAGAAPVASFPLTEAGAADVTLYLPNVLRLAVQAHWGENDIVAGEKKGINTFSREAAAELKRLGGKSFEGIEYPGQGHGVAVDTKRLATFFAAMKRDPFPADCRMLFHRIAQGRTYYVRATAGAIEEFDFTAKRVLTVSRAEDLPRAKRTLFTQKGYEITVRMPAGANQIDVQTRNLKEVEIELPVERLDFARPIRITANGRTVAAGVRKVDYAELLETARRTRDFERLIGGRLKATVAK